VRAGTALYQTPWRLTHSKQGKAFFFEKKKQKAFVCAVADSSGEVRVSTRKSFLVLFLEKGLLAFYESWSRPAGITISKSSAACSEFPVNPRQALDGS
jgi:hypothetical protein